MNTVNPKYYEIEILEPIDPCWADWFSGLEIAAPTVSDLKQTLLRGYLPDQASLYGVLGRIQSLNLTLLSVKWVRRL
ncbi:MAG: hypothetical protein GYA48_09780 [Chloroflexi bacterium]|nr:hypothetical protein [Chloroflexota bacterium]